MTEADELKLVQKLVMQRKDSAQLYTEQNREDLAKEELDQVAILEDFLPEQLDESAIEDEVKTIIDKAGATSMKDMGKVMGKLKEAAQGKADMGSLSAKVKARLSGG